MDVPLEYEDDVLEGDIVMVASDGVLDVLPSSFITAATNYLVGKMIEKKRNNKSLKRFDYDYDYDLADFVEGYVENLSRLSIKLQKIIHTDPPQIEIPPEDAEDAEDAEDEEDEEDEEEDEDENENENEDEVNYKIYPTNHNPNKQLTPEEIKILSNKQLKIPKPSFQKIKSKDISSDDNGVDEIEIDLFLEEIANAKKSEQDASGSNSQEINQELSPIEKINEAMEDIFKYEICNLFDPSEDNVIFQKITSYENFKLLTEHNLKHKDQQFTHSVDCFRNEKIKKTTTHHPYKNRWKCKDILDLTYPIHPVRNSKRSYHNFDKCVLKAIPKLPKKTTAR